MKLALFGATGRTGRHIVEQALEAGHSIHALVRAPDKLVHAPPGLSVFQGDIHDAALVGQTIEGAEAVLSVLGQTHGPDQTLDVMEVGARHIVLAMQENQVRRLIFAAGAGVRAAEDRPTVLEGVMTFLLRHLSRRVYEDAQCAIRIIQDSDLSWTITRAPRLIAGAANGSYDIGFVGPQMELTLRRGNMADFMLRQLADDQYQWHMPVAWDRNG